MPYILKKYKIKPEHENSGLKLGILLSCITAYNEGIASTMSVFRHRQLTVSLENMFFLC